MGGEMNKALYAHMNNKRKKKEVRQQIKHLSSSTFTFRKT
jgi:hypothetical protein